MNYVFIILLVYGKCGHPETIEIEKKNYKDALAQYKYWKAEIGSIADDNCELLDVKPGHRKIK